MTSPAFPDGPEPLQLLDVSSYQIGITTLTSAARALLQLADVIDLDQMQAVCGRFETLAPILEPTAYIRGGRDNLGDQMAFLGALRRFVDDLRKLDRRETSRG